MAYPTFLPFKSRHYQASSTSSNALISAPVVARGKYITAFYATTPMQSQTAAANTCEVLVNNSVVISSGGVVSTSTGNGATQIPVTATSAIFVNPGDVLVTVLSSCVGGTITHVVQEF